MGRKEMVFKVLGLVTTIAFGVIQLVIDYKRKITLTDADKEDIAERVAHKIKPVKVTKPKVSET